MSRKSILSNLFLLLWNLPSLGLLGIFLWNAQPEVASLVFICFLAGLINPNITFYVISLFGFLYLSNPGYHSQLVSLEGLCIGAIAGFSFRGLRKPDMMNPLKTVEGKFWIFSAIALMIMLTSSSVYGIILSLNDTRFFPNLTPFETLFGGAYFDFASNPEYTLKSLSNWYFGLSLALIAYCLSEEWTILRFFKFAAIGTVIALSMSVFNILTTKLGMPLLSTNTSLHIVNTDPLHQGRFAGTAGHAGWFAQWLVLTLPGFFIWYIASVGQKRKQLLIAVTSALVVLALYLTLARAAWLGAIVSMAVLFFGHQKIRSQLTPKKIGITAAALLFIAIIAFVISPEQLSQRLQTLLRASDRINYLHSTRDLIQHFPLGVGLGNHYEVYTASFPQFYEFFQPDHVYAHNLLLQVLAENGPLFLFIYVGLAGVIIWRVLKTWSHWNDQQVVIVSTLCASIVGLLVIGIAQFIHYIRSVDLFFWIILGLLLGYCRQYASMQSKRWIYLGLGLIGFALISGVITSIYHLNREPQNNMPNHWDVTYEDGSTLLSKWTPKKTSFAISHVYDSIEFQILRLKSDGSVTITWPDGEKEMIKMADGETAHVTHQFDFQSDSFFNHTSWIELEVDQIWIPNEYDPNSADYRSLGVFVYQMRMWNSAEEAEQ